MKFNIKKIFALIITVVICCSCFFCVEKAEAYSPPPWSGLIGYVCLYVEIIDVGEKTKTTDDATWAQLEVNIIDSYLKNVSGDIYIPSDCVDFVLSYDYGLIMLSEYKGDLMCEFEYDADSSMVIPFFPIVDNKIVIPSNYYKPYTYDDSMIIEACCDELFYIEYFNQYLLQINVNLSFSDGMDVELLNDYFNLVEEKCEAVHLSREKFLLKQYTIYFIQCLSLFNFFGGIVTILIFLIIYFVKKGKIKRTKNLNDIDDKKE